MHSRLINMWKKQTSSIFQTVLNKHIKKLPITHKPLLLCGTNQWVPSQIQSYSIDSSKDGVDLNAEVKLEDLSLEVSNPAVENIDYSAIANDDPEVLEKLKLIVLETDSLFQDGHNVPSHIKTDDWKQLLTLPSRSQRMKFLNFLFKKEMIKANEKAKKEARRATFDDRKAEALEERENNKHLFYGLNGNTLFHRIYDSNMNNIDNFRAMNSIQCGPDIIVDMDYYEYMNRLEQNTLAKQLCYIISDNRMLWEPYNVIFSSFDKESFAAKSLNKLIPNIYNEEYPFNYTTKHFTELNYSRNELVYLSPHTNNVLIDHTPGSVYVIGGMVDKRITQPFSLAKAKKEKIRCAKLPLDNFLDWGTGHKSLTLNQVMAIMNDWRRTNDWNYSFRHIPRRKLNHQHSDESSYLGDNSRDTRCSEVSAKFIKERKKRQLVYDLLLKR